MKLVRAAGGLIVRGGRQAKEIVLVHRPAYDDWSFPKGKLEPGEDERAAAAREVEEETGLVCRFGEDLGAITYVDARGRPKVVRYWEMAPPEGAEPLAGHEIDVARWVPLDEAGDLLTYAHDRTLLRRRDGGRPPGAVTTPAYLIRHGNAFVRKGWPASEPDELRPMSKTGRMQARRLAEHLADVSFARLVSSPFLRCIQTLEPLADARGIDIMIARELSEAEPPSGAEAWVLAAAADGPAALCTHGDIVRGLIDDLIERGVDRADGPVGYRKGSAWRLDVLDGRVTCVTYVPPFDRAVPVSPRPGRA
ncbi:MAG TPA: NUDIX domain-containing protein [Actinomycetota bacterium]|nr:NUDIX domain-containing protein [Actinomycetota bacterium]